MTASFQTVVEVHHRGVPQEKKIGQNAETTGVSRWWRMPAKTQSKTIANRLSDKPRACMDRSSAWGTAWFPIDRTALSTDVNVRDLQTTGIGPEESNSAVTCDLSTLPKAYDDFPFTGHSCGRYSHASAYDRGQFRSSVNFHGECSGCFSEKQGLRQGFVLEALLLSIFFEADKDVPWVS